MDKVQIYQELERRGELGKLPAEKQAIWAEYKRRHSPSAPAETPGQKAWNSFKEDVADLTYAPRKALSGATLGASDWALRKLGVGYDDTENRMGEVSPLAKGLTKVGGFGAELGGNIGGLGGGLVKALAGKGLKGLKLGMASGGIEGLATGATSSDTLSELPKNVALGGLIGTGGGMLGEGLTYLARPFSARSLTKGMKGGLNSVVENPEAVKLLNQGIKQSDDVASEFLFKSRPVARGINKDTANMVDSALTSRVDIPEAIRSANEKYGKYMDEHGADQIYSMLSPEEQKADNFAKWFEGSQIVDEAGKPLVVYHGTNADFDAFDPQMIGKATDNGFYGKGFYFTRNKGEASSYGNKVLPSYLKSKNMFDIRGVDGGYYSGLKDNMFEKGANLLDKLGLLDANQVEKYNFYKEAKNNFLKNVDIYEPSDVQDIWFGELTMPDGTKILNRAWESDNTRDGVLNVLWNDYARRIKYKDGTYLDHLLDGMSLKDYMRSDGINPQRFSDKLKSMGYDGIYQGDEYVVFNPNQIKLVNNSGAWSSSPSLSDAGWTPEPYIGPLYEGLNPFQAKSLKGAIVRGGEKLEKGAKLGSVDHFNKIKQDINSQISDLASRPGKESDVRLLEILKSSVDNKAPKELKVVDKIYEKAKRLENAFDRGKHYNPNNVEGADYISELSPLEQNAFAQGLFKRINNNSLTGKNLANTALGYENTLASVLRGDKYDDLMKGLNKQSTKFERLAGLGRKAESKLNTPEAQRFFGREQLESKGSMIGSALDWLNTKFRHDALERAGKNLLNPNYVGDSEAWLIENYPIIAGYLSSKLNQEVN